ncbi:hypothetical protein CE91St30_02020 [Raoultibacter timonensis]|uniref:Transposase n=1 Tax=Raoultibacter timonensis TaxID=1907662 RepID=A0ABN6MB91_9ACTN|nr:hypothetical protein CE91St30_02020 [Raoultibacter timonensis]BDF49472.1 hypothetical protein CE91St31_02020 [Raoultibacter timonensis]
MPGKRVEGRAELERSANRSSSRKTGLKRNGFAANACEAVAAILSFRFSAI